MDIMKRFEAPSSLPPDQTFILERWLSTGTFFLPTGEAIPLREEIFRLKKGRSFYSGFGIFIIIRCCEWIQRIIKFRFLKKFDNRILYSKLLSRNSPTISR